MEEVSQNINQKKDINKNQNKNKNQQNYFLLIEESIDKFMKLMPVDYEHYDIIKDILGKMINNLIYTAPELRLHKLYNIFFNLYTYLPKKKEKWAEICWGDMLDTYNKTVKIINSRN